MLKLRKTPSSPFSPIILILLVLPIVFGISSSAAVSEAQIAADGKQAIEESKTYLPLILRNFRTPSDAQRRFGTISIRNSIDHYNVEALWAGWYIASPRSNPPRPYGMEPIFLVLLRDHDTSSLTQYLAPYVQANRGFLWLIGNEPDRETYQDGIWPSDYAALYHTAYHFLKQEDPTCQVAIGGIVQPTPLRLQYLDMILDSYQTQFGVKMPVDVWNIHNQILREERGSWGAEIPPGIPADTGRLYNIQDNDSMSIFRQHIRAFRRWMADRGERNKPLILSEFGILMPEEYGFNHARVKTFMYASFDFLMSATDAELGYPADNNRLVQRWAWYSLDDKWNSSSWEGFNGHLYDPDTYIISQFGVDYGAYAGALGH